MAYQNREDPPGNWTELARSWEQRSLHCVPEQVLACTMNVTMLTALRIIQNPVSVGHTWNGGPICVWLGWSHLRRCLNPCAELHITKMYSSAQTLFNPRTDISWGSTHCKRGDDLDWPWTWEIVRKFDMEKNHNFALYLHSDMEIQTKLGWYMTKGEIHLTHVRKVGSDLKKNSWGINSLVID